MAARGESEARLLRNTESLRAREQHRWLVASWCTSMSIDTATEHRSDTAANFKDGIYFRNPDATDGSPRMKRSSRRIRGSLPVIMTELMMASWETMIRRGVMMAQGPCTPREYARMIAEKSAVSTYSALALMSGRGPGAAMRPWHKRAVANAKRLRRRC
jgi:hypothetical protein